MRKKLLFLLIVVLASLSARAETPAEAHSKHPDALCIFFETPADGGDLKNFDIERIAAYTSGIPRIALKIKGREKDIVKYVLKTMPSEDYAIGVTFNDGSALAIDKSFTFMVYMSTKGQGARFLIDQKRMEEYEAVLESSKH